MLVLVLVVRVAEQRAFQFHLAGLAVTAGQGEQADGLLQLTLGRRDLGFVGLALGGMLETDQVHGRAFQLQLQQVAVQCHVQAGDTMFMGTQAVMGVFVMVMLVGLGGDQGQQGEGQGEQQLAHGSLRREGNKVVTL